MRTANYTDLRANLKSYIDAVIDDYDTVVVNRGNGKGVVMISLDEYNSLKETEYIMSSSDTMEAIHKGEEDIKNGNFISQNEGESIEDFFKTGSMYRITLSEQARKEYLYFTQSGNKAILNKIKNLLEDIAAHPYTGIGKPEPLKYELAGKWSRRINAEHRIVYSVHDDIIEVYIFSMRYHYSKK